MKSLNKGSKPDKNTLQRRLLMLNFRQMMTLKCQTQKHLLGPFF